MRKLAKGTLPAKSRKSTPRAPARSGVAPTTSPAPGLADLRQVRQLEKIGGWTHRERLRILWYRLRLTVREMNYAARRVVELQMRLPP
jgi:hypothetical protein